jgi:hypothetical protein
MLDEERRVKRARVIEVLPGSLFEGKMGKILIIMILLQHQDAFGGESRDNSLRNRGLARPRAAANSNDLPLGHNQPSRMLSASILSASRPDANDLRPITAPVYSYFLPFFLPWAFLAARSSITAWAAASLAIGTRNGDALT